MDTLPDLLRLECPDYDYIPTSPMVDYSHESQGDVHFWLVFWAMSDFDTYERTVGRFNSEYGMQGLIPISSIH